MKALLKTASPSLFLIFSLFFSPWAGGSIVPVDPCYSPLEIAALFSANKNKKPSLKSQMKEIEKQLENKNKQLERLKEGSGSEYDQGIEGHIDKLTNSLDRQTEGLLVPQSGTYRGRRDKISTVAGELADYMESRQDDWNCEEGTSSADSPASIAADAGNVRCRDWQQDDSGYFGSNGKVNNSFCDDYANNPRDCKDALKKLKRDYQRISQIRSQITSLQTTFDGLEEQEWERKHGEGSDEDEDESGGICIQCLKELRALNGPSGGQIFGNVLTMGLGAALSVFGIREGRKMGESANEWWALQGVPAQNNLGYSLAGASLGFPFLAKGLHGLTHANAARGGYGCSPTSSPHSHMNPMLAMQMQQHQMQQMQFQSMLNPFAMNPMMQFQMNNPFAMNPMMQFQMNNPFAMNSMMNPMTQFQMNNPFAVNPMMNPMMQFQMNNPFAMNSMMNPMMQFQMNNPFAMNSMMNPMMQFQMNNPFAMNPMMQMPGVNPMFSSQYSQQAMIAMQTQMEVQKAVMAQRMSVYQSQMERQVRVGHLMQEVQKIYAQIQLEYSGGVNSMVSPGSLNTGLLTGQIGGGPQHNPATSPGTGTGNNDGDLPVVIGR